jgi:hypothetical protein
LQVPTLGLHADGETGLLPLASFDDQVIFIELMLKPLFSGLSFAFCIYDNLLLLGVFELEEKGVLAVLPLEGRC